MGRLPTRPCEGMDIAPLMSEPSVTSASLKRQIVPELSEVNDSSYPYSGGIVAVRVLSSPTVAPGGSDPLANCSPWQPRAISIFTRSWIILYMAGRRLSGRCVFKEDHPAFSPGPAKHRDRTLPYLPGASTCISSPPSFSFW